jgi:hypothetical protein
MKRSRKFSLLSSYVRVGTYHNNTDKLGLRLGSQRELIQPYYRIKL